GTDALVTVACDANGAMRADALGRALDDGALDAGRSGQATIVCAQAGNINTGAVDPIAEVCDLAEATGAWVHVDGAIGLWAAASARHRYLLEGVERADSWSADGHKWLNAPYDCGIALCAHPDDHAAAMGVTASYIAVSHHRGSDRRDQINWNPEWSRRARSVPVYAALAALGRRGVGELVDRSIAHARHMAERLAEEVGIEVLNEVVLNQVLVRFHGAGDSDQMTTDVIHRVQEDGACWVGGTRWQGRAAMRVSICGHNTTTDDVNRSADSILAAFAELTG
ncbi:MAG: pyridoxal-dependent decarboxylase, partial [Chloroflexota bacterium]|nr:pyridoxal-dependent decarboxylase [Chloroflexota bacterium]